jgi:hypothetical protein
MTLRVDPAGGFSGELTDATTGQTGAAFGTITAAGASGSLDITTVFGERSNRDFTQVVITQTDGHLAGSMRVPFSGTPPPGVPTPAWVLASFDLARQQ